MVIDPFVEQFINNLITKYPNKHPRHLFHYSDITNIISILNSNYLYSRKKAIELGLLLTDSAGQNVLSNTSNKYLECVRLYFRPKTPPLYNIEGFCPHNNQLNNYKAHCQVPIYLLFNSKKILSLKDVKFSNGNLASNPPIYYRKEDLSELEFDKIYHDTYFTQDQRSYKWDVINKRCAEVILPECLEIDNYLEYIICRSFAERETLINLLNQNLKNKYSNKILASRAYFNCNKHYIENVTLLDKEISIIYNNERLNPFEYQYKFNFSSGIIKESKNKLVKKWYWKKPVDSYSFSIDIDKHIAFKGFFKK